MDGWRALDVELDAWAVSNRIATFWWRDDDVTHDGPALRRLLTLAVEAKIPLALAAIPADARDDLVEVVGPMTGVVILQHGWDHRNHAMPSEKKAELARGRPWQTVVGELLRGQEVLSAMFPGRYMPVLVPPWNRIDPGLIKRLAGVGFIALSAFKQRATAIAAPGLRQVNCHVDPVDWSSRVFVGEDNALHSLITHLRVRREGAADPDEPTGLLTHHAVHDEPTWGFLRRLAVHVRDHAAASWIGIDSALGTRL